MTKEEITAQEIGFSLRSALTNLADARRLISERNHSIAWAGVTIAIREVEQAIRMMRQDYHNEDLAELVKALTATEAK